jgi:hypothetical protein
MSRYFTIAKYRLTLEAGEKGLLLPPYKGSTLRGGFGNAFRRISCALKEANCGKHNVWRASFLVAYFLHHRLRYPLHAKDRAIPGAF